MCDFGLCLCDFFDTSNINYFCLCAVNSLCFFSKIMQAFTACWSNIANQYAYKVASKILVFIVVLYASFWFLRALGAVLV